MIPTLADGDTHASGWLAGPLETGKIITEWLDAESASTRGAGTRRPLWPLLDVPSKLHLIAVFFQIASGTGSVLARNLAEMLAGFPTYH